MTIKTEDCISFEELMQLAQHKYAEQLPFVCYKYPHQKSVVFIAQNDDSLHHFTPDKKVPEGFVFAPFNSNSAAVIITPNNITVSNLPTLPITENTNLDILEDTNTEKQAHIALVTKAIEYINKGAFEKVVLSRKITLPFAANRFKSFANMVERYPSAFCYLFYHPKVGSWLAATPELLLYNYNGSFRTMALAGTMPTPSQKDKEVIWQAKEKEEQQIVTDTIVKQLQGYAEHIEVSATKTVQAGKVMHLCTEIKGKIKKEEVFEVINRLHPTPAVCGYPTEKARQFIINNESYDRLYYTGYCGNISEEEQALYVNLRCMQITDSHTYLYVGGGITKDSIAEKEYEETQNKALTMKSVVSTTEN